MKSRYLILKRGAGQVAQTSGLCSFNPVAQPFQAAPNHGKIKLTLLL
jgi:hypothetical protein